MTPNAGTRRRNFAKAMPADPGLLPFSKWPEINQKCIRAFQTWLELGGYGKSTQGEYAVAARIALAYLRQPCLNIDPARDLETVRSYIQGQYPSPYTRAGYYRGLKKFGEYLAMRQERAARPRGIHWENHFRNMPAWLCDHVRAYVAHKQKGWRAEDRHHNALHLLSPLCHVLRRMAETHALNDIRDITPQVWFDVLDREMADNYHPRSINARLSHFKSFLRFVEQHQTEVCQRTFMVQPLKCGAGIPKDASVLDLRRLLEENQRETNAAHARLRHLGIMDCAWIHLMLYSGLRTCEVRRLKVEDINFETRRIRIEQSKGLKDRMVFMNSATISALKGWMEARGNPETFPKHVFLYHCLPFTLHYCQNRLKTYGKRCGVKITPHQLRHSCATLLLNAGAPLLSVKVLLGHERLDTTLGYARLYDGTVAADYYHAMSQVEGLFNLSEERRAAYTPAEMVALLDSLSRGTLNESQRETLHVLRQGILALKDG